MKNLKDTSVQYVKGVGPSRKKLFAQLGVESVEDLLYLFPRRYEDRRHMKKIADAKIGEWQTVTGTITSHDARRAWYTKKHVCEIKVDDGDACIWGVWFNQPFMSHYFELDHKIVLYGKVDSYKDRLQMVSPEYEVIGGDAEDESLSIGRIVPIYPLTKGMTQRYLRRTIKFCLDHYTRDVADVLPYSLRSKYDLMNLVKSLINIHFPEGFEIQENALKRVSFEEFFLFQVSVLLRKMSIVQKKGIAHTTDTFSCDDFDSRLAFSLTGAQKRVIEEIRQDMQRPSPMHRLLQGEVGSGKTIVAFFGCLKSINNGYQSTIMAPTEILARQHFDVLNDIIKSGGFENVSIGFLTGSLDKKEREALYKKVKDGTINLLIGTHALIQQELDFKRLSFVVVDEQHKFGVRQRALLPAKGIHPDVLIMTATPIPRTLCLTLYGDLDISTLDELPPGRGKTETLFFSEESAADAYKIINDRMKNGQQAYIVYPIIEESRKLDLKAAKEMFEHFKDDEFKDFRLGLVHGQMKRKDANKTMQEFKDKKIDILLATTILEVGVDVPNANVMVIEHAERFGLSQLHQLRGRIGRGSEDAVCILIGNPLSVDAHARVEAITSTTDGFEIAQKDLMIRGPGQFFGRHQHGLNELKVANPATQLDILELARKEALDLIQKDAKLQDNPNKQIRAVIEQRYPSYLELVRAG